MEDMLRSLYESNEKYHDTKENMLWLAATVYLAFSVGAINWIIPNRLFVEKNTVPVIVFLSAMFLFSLAFTIFQNWMKCLSVLKSEKYLKLIGQLDDADKKKYVNLVAGPDYSKICFFQKVPHFLSLGYSGVIIILLTAVFYIAQLYIVLCRSL